MGVLGDTPNTAAVALNFVRSRAPVATDDISAGYAVGSHWTDTESGSVYICSSHAVDAATWVEVVSSTEPPAQQEWIRTGIMRYNLGSDSFTDESRYPWTSLLVLSPTQTANRQTWQSYWAAQPRPWGRHVFYKTLFECVGTSGGSTYSAIPTSQTVPTATRFNLTSVIPADEVKWHDANYPSDRWQMWASNGTTPKVWSSYPQSFLIDPAAASMQALMLSYARGQIQAQGYDGIFFDNCLVSTNAGFPFYRLNSSGTPVVAYADAAAWADAVENCVQNVCGQLRAEGFYVSGNVHWFVSGQGASNTGAAKQAWLTRLGPYMDSMMGEYSAVTANGNVRRGSDTDPVNGYWKPWTGDHLDACHAVNSGFIMGAGSANDQTNRRYTLASLRVWWDGSYDAFYEWQGTIWDSTLNEIAWGTSQSAVMQSGTVYARRWSGAWAVINTNRSSSASATFPDPVAGGTRTFLNLGAADAYVGA